MSSTDIDLGACRSRQKRLLDVMHAKRLDLVIVTRAEHVQWLAGPRFAFTFAPAAALHSNGRLILVAPAKPPVAAAADKLLTYEAQWHSTLRNDQRTASTAVLLNELRQLRPLRQVGVEFSAFAGDLLGLEATFVDIEPELYRLRRKKDVDELALLRKAIAATGRMYARAREILRPGVSELEVFNELQAVAVREFGEPLTGTGNDYRCAERGGPPRAGHTAQAGQLYILDLGPAYRGYFADNARTLAVSDPTAEQVEAWSYVMRVFTHVQESVRPGTNCRELFQAAQGILAEAPCGEFNHHLGHGIGLFPHEAPHLNPHWDDSFEVGDVFTAEPGLYAPELQVGMRVENDYLVTADGIELLSNFPLDLKL